jgi:hypothetical protein
VLALHNTVLQVVLAHTVANRLLISINSYKDESCEQKHTLLHCLEVLVVI